MKKLKKLVPFLTALTLLFSSAACGGGTDSAGGSSSSSLQESSFSSSDGGGSSSSSGSSAEETDEGQKAVNEALANLSAEDFTYAQLMGTDSLGRKTMPVIGKEKKYVGIFYFVLLGQETHDTIYDITKLLETYGSSTTLPDGRKNPIFDLDDKTISPYSRAHYWGEPLYGYYKSTDKWVIRRHLELFMNAGIDFLYLDYSNGHVYPAAVDALIRVIKEMQDEGYKNVPTIAFLCPNAKDTDSAANQMGSVDVLDYLWRNYYSDSEYDSCWFRGDKSINRYENPLVIGRFASATEKEIPPIVRDSLWLKELQWPMGMKDTPDAFPWMEWNAPGTTQYNHSGIMNVSVAQHVNSWSSTSYLDSLTPGKKYSYRARGWDPAEPDKYGADEEKVLAGSNFEWQWQNALAEKDDLYMLTLTGWNEWVAPKVNYGTSYGGVFNDAFNCAFSRDAEMMKGGYGDNYYMQIARNVREFSGIREEGTDNVALFGQVKASGIADAASLPARFLDIGSDALARTDKAIDDKIDYSDTSNRNNILETRVGNDGENLYVAVKTKDDVKGPAAGDTNWMTLYLSVGSGGWENYKFVINRTPELAAGTTSIEKFTGSKTSTISAGSAKIAVSGDTVFYTIPLSALGVSAGEVVGIKATDNLQAFGDADDFYISGDCAPLGRLNYAYKIA